MGWHYKTSDDLTTAGYRYEGTGTCKGEKCGQLIQWWRTPKGKAIPLDPDTKEPHFSTCPDAEQFRKKKKDDVNSRERRMQRGAMQ